MLNNVFLVGRLVRNPEISVLTNGTSMSRFTLAVSRKYKDDKGNTPTDFINCVLWGRRAENFVQYMCKGTLVGVLGEIRTTKSVKNGVTRYFTDVNCSEFQFIEPKDVVQRRMEKQGNSHVSVVKDASVPMDVIEDDLPF
ncbi:single-strand DNA-binding protein [Pilibacter termitis]|uniref:Single-stranded DNA-binding protein n=1 Tax=Pilibacter termitis TaxID=263852 RepID=A0A1T4P479_9ENTE|nr:single-stranded DNA-binding protein [Pilibacter termitis]SJZ86056.1 single-strand DNA-binding protein [Pilibacter termitis]